MISKQEFSSVVSQVNSRFDWFTKKINELEAKVAELEAAPEPKKAAPKKAAK